MASRILLKGFELRRSADIRHFIDTDTSFPKRLDKEETYAFTPEYRKLFNDVIQFAREFVTTGDERRPAGRAGCVLSSMLA